VLTMLPSVWPTMGGRPMESVRADSACDCIREFSTRATADLALCSRPPWGDVTGDATDWIAENLCQRIDRVAGNLQASVAETKAESWSRCLNVYVRSVTRAREEVLRERVVTWAIGNNGPCSISLRQSGHSANISARSIAAVQVCRALHSPAIATQR
jgi:hypothetical protein